jgi:hypothetical protein
MPPTQGNTRVQRDDTKLNSQQKQVIVIGELRTLPQGDFLTVSFKCLVGMRTGPLTISCCFLPAAIKDADAERV